MWIAGRKDAVLAQFDASRVAGVRGSSAESARETLLRSREAEERDRMTTWRLDEFMKILEATWIWEVCAKVTSTTGWTK